MSDITVWATDHPNPSTGAGVLPPAYAGPGHDATDQALFGHLSHGGRIGFSVTADGTLQAIVGPVGSGTAKRLVFYDTDSLTNPTTYGVLGYIEKGKLRLDPWVLGNHPIHGVPGLWLSQYDGQADYVLLRYGTSTIWNTQSGGAHSWRVSNAERMSLGDTALSVGVAARVYSTLMVDSGITSLLDVSASRRFWQQGADTGFGPDWNQAHYVVAGAGYYGGRFAANYSNQAVQWRVAQWEPNEWAAVNMNMGGYVPVAGSGFHTVSTRTTKRAIRSLHRQRERIVVKRDPWADTVPEELDIMALRPVAFRPRVGELEWNEETQEAEPATHPVLVHKGRRERVGLIAEEVARVIPSAVSMDLNGNSRSIDYAQVTVALLAHVQRLTETVETLTYRVRELEGQA